MKLKAVMLTVVVAVLGGGFGTKTAQASLISEPKNKTLKAILHSQTINLRHNRYVCNNGRPALPNTMWACKAIVWLRRERKETLKALNPVNGSFPLPACTVELVNREGGMRPDAVNPTSGAYGAPQALPGSKMSSAGPDWRTNLWTQLRWMIGYVEKYGGMCSALAFQRANGWY